MPRIRTIKPEMCGSPSMARVSLAARWCFVGLITQSDDHGRQLGSPRTIAGVVFPNDDHLTVAEVDGLLAELEDAGMIHRYEVDAVRYLQICNWEAHQKVSKPAPSRLPDPPPEPPANPAGNRGEPADPAAHTYDLGPSTLDHGPPPANDPRVSHEPADTPLARQRRMSEAAKIVGERAAANGAYSPKGITAAFYRDHHQDGFLALVEAPTLSATDLADLLDPQPDAVPEPVSTSGHLSYLGDDWNVPTDEDFAEGLEQVRAVRSSIAGEAS